MIHICFEESLETQQGIISPGNNVVMDFRNTLQAPNNASQAVSMSTASYEITTTFDEEMKSHIEYKAAEKIWQVYYKSYLYSSSSLPQLSIPRVS